MTPAQELRAAAARLREEAQPLLADGAEKDWSEFFTLNGADLGLGPHDEQWIALVGPALAEPLAQWLETEAHMVERRDLSAEGQTFHALKVARAINGRSS